LADPSTLRRFAPIFVEAVERWREISQKIVEGRYDKDRDGPKLPTPGMRPGGPGVGPGQGPGQGPCHLNPAKRRKN